MFPAREQARAKAHSALAWLVETAVKQGETDELVKKVEWCLDQNRNKVDCSPQSFFKTEDSVGSYMLHQYAEKMGFPRCAELLNPSMGQLHATFVGNRGSIQRMNELFGVGHADKTARWELPTAITVEQMYGLLQSLNDEYYCKRLESQQRELFLHQLPPSSALVLAQAIANGTAGSGIPKSKKHSPLRLTISEDCHQIVIAALQLASCSKLSSVDTIFLWQGDRGGGKEIKVLQEEELVFGSYGAVKPADDVTATQIRNLLCDIVRESSEALKSIDLTRVGKLMALDNEYIQMVHLARTRRAKFLSLCGHRIGKRLELKGNISDTAARLHTLELGMQELASAVTDIDLSAVELRDSASIQELASAIANLPQLESLSGFELKLLDRKVIEHGLLAGLGGDRNRFSNLETSVLAMRMSQKGVTSVDFSGRNSVDEHGLLELTKLSQAKHDEATGFFTLCGWEPERTTLEMNGERFKNIYIAEIQCTRRLLSLRMERMRDGESMWQKLADALRENSSLTSVNLLNNRMDLASVQKLEELLTAKISAGHRYTLCGIDDQATTLDHFTNPPPAPPSLMGTAMPVELTNSFLYLAEARCQSFITTLCLGSLSLTCKDLVDALTRCIKSAKHLSSVDLLMADITKVCHYSTLLNLYPTDISSGSPLLFGPVFAGECADITCRSLVEIRGVAVAFAVRCTYGWRPYILSVESRALARAADVWRLQRRDAGQVGQEVYQAPACVGSAARG